MGIVERVSGYSPLLWVLVLAIVLLRTVNQASADNPGLIKSIVN
jgi:hypothetical protein